MNRQAETIGMENDLQNEIIDLAKEYDINKVVLFGSRARNDHNRTSDIDLAVSGGDIVGFTIDIDERINTLLKFDVVNLDADIQQDLIDSIKTEGKLLYEKI